MLGDFNSNKRSSGERWTDLEKLLDRFGFVSVYHTKSGEQFGAETRHTHFYRGKPNNGFHIDYCFVPKDWESRITNVAVPAYEEWADVSDHVPLIVDVHVAGD